MKPLLLLFIGVILFASCENRKCECSDDITFTWKDDIELDSTFITIPNAVLNIGFPLAFQIYSFGQPVTWELKSAYLNKDNKNFLENEDLSSFIESNSIIEFPHELFFSNNEEPITGPLNVDIEIYFPERNANLLISGSIYFYSCEDIDDDFGREECRWPSQLTGEVVINFPC